MKINFPILLFFVTLLASCQAQTEHLPEVSNPHRAEMATIFSDEVMQWGPEILAGAQEHDLEPDAIATLMQVTSCGNPNYQIFSPVQLRSSVGGLFLLHNVYFESGEDMLDPETNMFRSLNYYKRQLDDAEGSHRLAFAAYHAGTNALNKEEAEWHPSTIAFAYWANGIYEDAKLGETDYIDRWFAEYGGAALCSWATEG